MNAADGGHRHHAIDAMVLQRPQVGAVVHLVRRNGVAVAVTCQKDHFLPADAAKGECARRFAVRRARHLAVGDFKIGELGQPGAADNSQHIICPLS